MATLTSPGILTFDSLVAAMRAGCKVESPTKRGYVVSKLTAAGRIRAPIRCFRKSWNAPQMVSTSTRALMILEWGLPRGERVQMQRRLQPLEERPDPPAQAIRAQHLSCRILLGGGKQGEDKRPFPLFVKQSRGMSARVLQASYQRNSNSNAYGVGECTQSVTWRG